MKLLNTKQTSFRLKSDFSSTFKLLFLTVLLNLTAPAALFSQGCWTQVANMPQSRYNAVSFDIGDTAYLVTGQASGGPWQSDFFKYDPNSNTWTQLPDFPGTARTGAVGFSINGKGYVGTGRDDNGNRNDFWEYDPTSGQWTQKANFPPGNREDATGFSIGNKGYVGMGLNGSAKTDFYEYDPVTNIWTQKANFPVGTGRYGAVGFSIGTKGYVGTGYHSGFTSNNDFWEYDPATNSWLQLANVPGPARAEASGFSVGNYGYLGIGNQFSDFYRYDVSTNTWSQITNYGPGKRHKAATFVVNGIAYVGSGFYLSIKSDWWKFDPASYETLPTLTDCDSVLYNGNYYTTSETVTTIVPGVTANACDSVYLQPIVVKNSSSAVDVITACDSYMWIDGNTYTASNNTATFTLTNTSGCDSIVTLDLTVNYSNTGTDVITACDSYTWIDGNTYTSSNNTATFTLTNTGGCDSIVTLDLTMNYSNTGTDVITACDSYTWIDGNTYTASNNTATFTLTNTGGCDSIVTLDLTVNYSNTGTDVITACDSYTWIDGNTYTASNNTATFTLTNTGGCDSIVTLDLTVNYSNTATDVITACDSYTWIDGNTYTASNNTATFTLTNTGGCDSIVTLDLTVNYSNTGTDVITACDSYTWIDGNTYTASNNTATFTLTNTGGCDSIVTLDLTVNYSNTGTDVITACDSYTWIDGNTYTASNNTAIFTLTNTGGCDSIVTLNLTIHLVDITTTNASPILSANQAGGTYQWIDCDNNNAVLSGETGQMFTATSNGNYAVIINDGICIDTSACMNVNNVGIDELPDVNVSISPNPSSGIFNIQLPQGSFKLTVMDLHGKELIGFSSAQANTQVDLSSYENAVYLLKIEHGKTAILKKLVKY